MPNTIYKLLKLKFERSDNAFKSQALAFCSLIQKYHVKLKELFDFNLDHKGELCLSEKLSNKKGSFVYADIDIFKLLMSKEELHQNLLSKINETRSHSNDNECTAVEDEYMLNELYSEFWLMQRSPRI